MNCSSEWTFMNMPPSPCEVQLLVTYENDVAIFCFPALELSEFSEFLDATSFPVSMIQIQKRPMIPDFYLSRQVSPPLQPSTHQGMHFSAFLENSTLRRVWNFFLPSRQVSLKMLLFINRTLRSYLPHFIRFPLLRRPFFVNFPL